MFDFGIGIVNFAPVVKFEIEYPKSEIKKTCLK